MPRSTPDAATLLRAAVKYLEEELMPTLSGYHRFKTRVTANVLNTIRREHEMHDQQAAAEAQRLSELLGQDCKVGEVEALSQQLAKRIRSGLISIESPALRAHIRKVAVGCAGD